MGYYNILKMDESTKENLSMVNFMVMENWFLMIKL